MEITVSYTDPSRTELLPPPDGETTDTTDSGRINSAIRQVYNAGGGTVYLEAGKYYIGSSIRLRSGVSIKGKSLLDSGLGGTVLEVTADIRVFSTFIEDDVPENIYTLRNLSIEDLLIIPSVGVVSTKSALHLVGFRYGVDVKRVTVKEFYNGVYLSYSWKSQFNELCLKYCKNAGMVIKNSANRVTIRDGEFNDSIYGIKLEKGNLYNANVRLEGNLFERNDYGVWVDHTDLITIENNYFEVNNYAGVLLRGELGATNKIANIHGNRFFGNSTATKGDYGIDTRIYSERYHISGNSFVGLELSAIRVTKGIMEGFIHTNEFRTSNYVVYTGTGYTPIVVNGLSFDLKGSQTRGRAEESGYTADRPIDPVLSQVFYDRTIGKPIWWTGSNWKDALGTIV